MENSADWEQKNLINELIQGRELAKQLQIHLNVTTSSHETRKWLVHKILNSYDKALSMMKWNGSVVSGEPAQPSGSAAMGMAESPRSHSGSPHSEDSDRDFKDHEHKDGSRKRKSVMRWTKQVQVWPGTGLEGPLDDGYSWRKYGQKDILGAKYPRGYYRCTHRNVQGCLATKQIQRSDEDPTMFEITYRGRHTCTPAAAAASPDKQEPNTSLQNHHQTIINQQNHQQRSQEILFNFQTGLEVITGGDQSIPLSYFPPSTQINAENYVDSASTVGNDYFMGDLYGSFVCPATSGSTSLSASPNQMASFGGNRSVEEGLERSELVEMVSAAAATNSPTVVGLDFPFGAVDQFDTTFSFDDKFFYTK